jgi:hypothetical protein
MKTILERLIEDAAKNLADDLMNIVEFDKRDTTDQAQMIELGKEIAVRAAIMSKMAFELEAGQ